MSTIEEGAALEEGVGGDQERDEDEKMAVLRVDNVAWVC